MFKKPIYLISLLLTLSLITATFFNASFRKDNRVSKLQLKKTKKTKSPTKKIFTPPSVNQFFKVVRRGNKKNTSKSF